MSQHVYILHNESNDYVVKEICRRTIVNSRYFCENLELTEDDLIYLAEHSPSDYFYVISTNYDLDITLNAFDYKPPAWDGHYLHIWPGDNIRLYSKYSVLESPDRYTDKRLFEGKAELKRMDNVVAKHPTFDIIFLSYDESFADQHFHELSSRYRRAKRVHGVKGIYEAHKEAARIAETDMFYVVDADARILDSFDFDCYHLHSLDRQSVHVWTSSNPVNHLKYGYGGVKLFPTKALRNYTGSPIDFTTSVSNGFKVMDEVSNLTYFNTDPFSTWRSAFRECTKLAAGLIRNQDHTETEHRLNIWCTVGDGEYGEFALMGANEGRDFGTKNANHPDMLRMINDYTWLEDRFSS